MHAFLRTGASGPRSFRVCSFLFGGYLPDGAPDRYFPCLICPPPASPLCPLRLRLSRLSSTNSVQPQRPPHCSSFAFDEAWDAGPEASCGRSLRKVLILLLIDPLLGHQRHGDRASLASTKLLAKPPPLVPCLFRLRGLNFITVDPILCSREPYAERTQS